MNKKCNDAKYLGMISIEHRNKNH